MRAVFVALFVLAGVAPAAAYTQQDADACTPDAFRLCVPFIPDAGKIEACLRANRKQLTPGCAAVFAPADSHQARRAQQPRP